MAVQQIGQLRRDQIPIQNYTSPITYTQQLITKDIDISGEESIINFYDQCLFLSGENTLSSLFSYYLKFRVKQFTDSTQDFSIKLQTDSVMVDNTQVIRILNVKQGINYTTFELIFNPNANYNQLVFELRRQALDFYITNTDGTSGRLMDIEILQFEKVLNVIGSIFPGKTLLKKIGIQGPPGLLFCLDGEEIRIGRSGVYELYNDDISIAYIGFIIKDSLYTQDGKDYFIMDYKY